jgi:hypothetical protein
MSSFSCSYTFHSNRLLAVLQKLSGITSKNITKTASLREDQFTHISLLWFNRRAWASRERWMRWAENIS